MEDLIESSTLATLSQRSLDGALRVDPEITPPVLILGDSDSGSRERSMALQEEEEKNSQKSTSVVMKSEVEGQLPSRNVVTSDG